MEQFMMLYSRIRVGFRICQLLSLVHMLLIGYVMLCLC